MDASIESIVSKIKKLLALTVERGATVEESANAAAKAQALLFEHNLTMSTVQSTPDKTNEEAIEKIEMEIEGGRNVWRWKRSLLHVVAKYNFCAAVNQSGTADVWIVGRRSNVMAVEYLTEYLEGEIERLAKHAAKSIATDKARYKMSFCLGAVASIYKRLKEQSEQSASVNASSHALVVQSNALIEKAKHEFFPSLGRSRAGSIAHASGYHAGMEAGRNIGLHRGVATTKGCAGLLG